jgi:hypothetical protein
MRLDEWNFKKLSGTHKTKPLNNKNIKTNETKPFMSRTEIIWHISLNVFDHVHIFSKSHPVIYIPWSRDDIAKDSKNRFDSLISGATMILYLFCLFNFIFNCQLISFGKLQLSLSFVILYPIVVRDFSWWLNINIFLFVNKKSVVQTYKLIYILGWVIGSSS